LWATWCGPCRLETPELVKLHKEFRSHGLEVVGLSTENPDTSADQVREFVHNYDVDYRVGWSGQDVAITLMQGRDAIPQSFVISRSGRVVKRFVGFNPVFTPPQIREAIQEALNEKAAAD
jgi:cytochrome c biogenesis protein CcmG/thiol:disulfide interchange protein DsbE